MEVTADYSFRAEGLHTPSGFGINRGHWGEAGEMTLYPENEETFHPPKYGVRTLPPTRLKALSPGGGGWGDPLERDPEAVFQDIRNGVVSLQAASELYGVKLSKDGLQIDWETTEQQRMALRD